MKPVSPVLPSSPGLPELVLAKNQPQYRTLPTVQMDYSETEITIITRYQMTDAERERVSLTGEIWLEQMTFGDRLQPQRVTVYEPLTVEDRPGLHGFPESDQSKLVAVHDAARALSDFLDATVGLTDDWPVEIKADNDADANRICELLNKLKAALTR